MCGEGEDQGPGVPQFYAADETVESHEGKKRSMEGVTAPRQMKNETNCGDHGVVPS